MLYCYLALKKRNKNYYPLSREDLTTFKTGVSFMAIEEIDLFTMQHNIHTLRLSLFEKGVISEEDLDKEFVIVHYDNQQRELPYGVCFKTDAKYLSKNFLKEYILSANKQTRNQIKNVFNNLKDKTPALTDLLEIINEIDEISINNIDYLDYIERRSLGLYVNKLINKRKKEEDNSITITQQNNVNNGDNPIPKLILYENKDKKQNIA